MLKKMIPLWGFIGSILLLSMLQWFLVDPATSTANNTYLITMTPSSWRPEPEQSQPFSRLAQSTIYCSVEITTSDKAPFNNHALSQAAPLADYFGQSLLNVSSSTTVPPTDLSLIHI